jgi:hypothetical protein
MTATDNASVRIERVPSDNALVRWWTRWRAQQRAYRRKIAFVALDLRERHGAAARDIALNSSRQSDELAGRRFWRRVVRDLNRVR